MCVHVRCVCVNGFVSVCVCVCITYACKTVVADHVVDDRAGVGRARVTRHFEEMVAVHALEVVCSVARVGGLELSDVAPHLCCRGWQKGVWSKEGVVKGGVENEGVANGSVKWSVVKGWGVPSSHHDHIEIVVTN